MSEPLVKSTHALSKEELEKHIARVTMPRKPVELSDPFPLCPTKKLPQSKIEDMVHHLYTQSMELRAANIAELEAHIYKSEGVDHTPLDQDEIELSVRRLYNDAVLQKKENLNRSRNQYLFRYPKTEKKILLKDIVQHMYSDRIAAKEKTAQKLYDKYIRSTEIDAFHASSVAHK
ncbi:unnamed protein product [Phytomonas sp. EM1]|nr:unnamed protein product [Phytomonas sp. EM1]|eukprot:CCW59999.1 unnamed protein product [Phytomonas sp. isolate EM1]